MEIILYAILLTILIPTVYAAISGAPTMPSIGPNIEEALREAGVGLKKEFYELGTGTGNVSKKALKMGALVTGYELSPIAYIWTAISLSLTGQRFKLKMRDFFKEDLSEADVIYTFLTPRTIGRLEKKLRKEAKKRTIVISYAFPMIGIPIFKKIEDGKTAPIYIYKIN